MSDQMTHKERILAAINHQPLDRVPLDYAGEAEATAKFKKALGVKDDLALYKALDLDKLCDVSPAYLKGRHLPGGGLVDFWGVVFKPVPYDKEGNSYQEMFFHPLERFETIDEIEANYTWPKLDWFDFSALDAQFEKFSGYATLGGYIAPFYYYSTLRGLENSLIDMAGDEDMADYIIGKVCDFLYDYHKRMYEYADGRIDVSFLADDFGTQTGLMISLEMFDRFFKGHYQRFAKLIKDFSIKVMHHDDGAIMPLLPRLVDEVGIEVLDPIQWHVPGMDLETLKDRFGQKICFHGGVDNQFVLPMGTVEDVRKETLACLETLARDGTGLILGPCHNVQVNTPVENLLALYQTAKDFRLP